MAAVVSHPYEHGHPDHDAAALTVVLACERIARQGGSPPARLEFASYNMRDGNLVLGAFWPQGSSPELVLRLAKDELDRKRATMDCFVTQKGLGGRFPLTPERLRAAPACDFHAPAPPREAVYERWGIAMTLAKWRRHAAAALQEASGTAGQVAACAGR